MSLRIGSIVVSVRDLRAMEAFWRGALGYEPLYPSEPGFVLLGSTNRHDLRPNLALDVRKSATSEPPRMHLDLYTDNQQEEVERLIALGATRFAERNRPSDADYVMLCDPDGNRFCVIDGGG